MLEFITTLSILLLIFIEIVLTIFCVKKLQAFEIKIDEINLKMLEGAKKVLEINDEIQKIIKKINKIIRILSNKKLHQAKRMIMMTIDVIQVIMLIKSFDLAKGKKKINFKLLKNVAYARITQQVLRKFLEIGRAHV